MLVEDVVLIGLTPSAVSRLLARERPARLSVGIGRLSETMRSIFLAHRIDGLTYSEIARARGINISTVHQHVAKATPKLTTWMEDW